MATLVSLTLDVLDQIHGQAMVERPAEDLLATAVSSNSDTSFQFEGAGTSLWERGDYAEVMDGAGTAGEVIKFFADHNEVESDVRVERGMRRSTAASSHSKGTRWVKNPPHTVTEIVKAINEVVDSDMQNGIWYRTQRTIAYTVGRDRYPVNASDYKIERMRQRDVTSTNVGTVTFDFTAGAQEDLWTSSSAHNLVVNDTVRFSAVGTGADEYGLGVVYYVVNVDSTTTFRLSTTEGGSVLAGTVDSSGTWTLEKIVWDYREFHDGDYKLLTNQDTIATSTGKDVLIRRVVSSDDTIYYTARTRPASSAISSLPTEIANAIPYGAVARLVGGTATRTRPASETTISYADAAWFRDEFNRQISQIRMRLFKELRPLAHFEFGPTSSGDFRGGFGSRSQDW